MTRGAVGGLGTPTPISTLMPAIFQEDPFTTRWTGALDEVLAPVISTLDCLGAYIDPRLAPEDFLSWLANWYGAVLDENWPPSRRREAVARAVSLFRTRGTVAGLRELLELASGGRVEIEESGGTTWSAAPGRPLPGSAEARLTVRIFLSGDEDGTVDPRALDELIMAAKPAHMAHTVEIETGRTEVGDR